MERSLKWRNKIPTFGKHVEIMAFLIFSSIPSCDLDLWRRSRSLMQMKGFDVVYLFCKFGVNILLGAWVMALWLFHIRKIPYLREGACVTLKGHQSKLVWYVHHHHGWVYHWYNIYPFRPYEHFAIAGRKRFFEKTHFFAKIGFKCICNLDLCTYDKKISRYN